MIEESNPLHFQSYGSFWGPEAKRYLPRFVNLRSILQSEPTAVINR